MTKPHGNTRWTDEHRAEARRLYVEQGKSPDEVSGVIGCSSRSVQTWVKEGAWREARQGWLSVHGMPVEDLEDRALRRLLGRLEREGDALPVKELLELLRTINSFKQLIAKRQGFRVVDAALVVGDEFEAYVLRECPEEAPHLLEAWKGFLEDLNRRSAQ